MVSNENYEIWMMDYLDGNLSDADRALLFHFLEQNPHLKEELEGLDKAVVSPQEEVFVSKHMLLKASVELADIPYPEYVAIKEVESGLENDELHWKASYLKQDKTRSTLFALYSKVILKADLSLRYPLQSSLKRVVWMPVLTVSTFKWIGAAAAIVFLLSIGSVSLIQKTRVRDNIVAVNNRATPVLQPKTTAKIETPDVIQEKSVRLKTKPVPLVVKKESILVTNPKPPFETIKIEPLSSKKIHLIKTQHINAYEIGLNAMMPILIANNLADRKDDQRVLQSHLSQQSEQLTRNARMVTGSIKVINFLAGNETKVKKVLNQDGQMVAYQVESDNISIRQRIKSTPVTN